MKKIQYTTSPGVPPQRMEDEFLCHRNGSEWWYCTGFINDATGKLFSFQFTLARVRIYMVQFHILMTALTDFKTKKHYYAQQPIFFGRNVTVTSEKVGLNGIAEMKFSDMESKLDMVGEEYSLSLEMEAVKSPIWHCDNGVLKMGVDDPKETTYYWSYTNLAASGKLTLGDKQYEVSGKAWFDKQGELIHSLIDGQIGNGFLCDFLTARRLCCSLSPRMIIRMALILKIRGVSGV